jgi:hypothetical protein
LGVAGHRGERRLGQRAVRVSGILKERGGPIYGTHHLHHRHLGQVPAPRLTESNQEAIECDGCQHGDPQTDRAAIILPDLPAANLFLS